MANEPVILQCRALSKAYGPKPALKNFTADFAAGRITGLLGPNGSGKTTLLKLAAGLLTPSGGSITVCGRAPGPWTKARTAYLPDRPCLPAGLTVGDAVALYRDFYPDFDPDKAAAMLADLKLQPADKADALSKGAHEKLQLVLTMSRRASLYLLDEPLGGVDPAARDYILDTIIRNYSEEAALVISTHLIGDIEKVLDDLVMIREGEILLFGAAEELREEHGKSVDALFREVFQCT